MLRRVGETVDPKDAVVKIKDASFPAPFASELEYNSPVHGNWNIVHTGMQAVSYTHLDLHAADRIRERFSKEGKTAVCYGMGNGLDDVKRCV